MILSYVTVQCDNAGDGKCNARAVIGAPQEDKKDVLLKAMNEFGFSNIRVEDSHGYVDYFLLCPDCARSGRHPKR